MGAEAPESDKLVEEREEESQSLGPVPETTNERSESKDARINSRQEQKQPQRLRKAVFHCMKRLSVSPLLIVKRARDCYVSSLGGCAQSFGSYQPGFGGGSMNVPPAFAASPANFHSRYMDSSRFDEDCLSPAFKKAFNEEVYSRSASYVGHEGTKHPFGKSFGDFESGLNPTMRRAYSEATAFSRFPKRSGIEYRGPSPGWTPNRIGAGIMFPIQETPEYIRPSLRKVSDDSTQALDEEDSFGRHNDVALNSLKVEDSSEAGKGHSQLEKVDVETRHIDVKDDVSASQSQVPVFPKMPRPPTRLMPSISM